MTAWDMVSIAIVNLTFELAFYFLLGGGFVAGLLFLVWITKQAVSHMEKTWMLKKITNWLDSDVSPEDFRDFVAVVIAACFLLIAMIACSLLGHVVGQN